MMLVGDAMDVRQGTREKVAALAAGPIGKLAKEFCGLTLPLQVLQSNAGFYLGTTDEEGPVSRESLEYWPTYTEAEKALSTREWTQKETP